MFRLYFIHTVLYCQPAVVKLNKDTVGWISLAIPFLALGFGVWRYYANSLFKQARAVSSWIMVCTDQSAWHAIKNSSQNPVYDADISLGAFGKSFKELAKEHSQHIDVIPPGVMYIKTKGYAKWGFHPTSCLTFTDAKNHRWNRNNKGKLKKVRWNRVVLLWHFILRHSKSVNWQAPAYRPPEYADITIAKVQKSDSYLEVLLEMTPASFSSVKLNQLSIIVQVFDKPNEEPGKPARKEYAKRVVGAIDIPNTKLLRLKLSEKNVTTFSIGAGVFTQNGAGGNWELVSNWAQYPQKVANSIHIPKLH